MDEGTATSVIRPDTMYRLRSKAYHKNFVVETTEDPVNAGNWTVKSLQVIPYSNDFKNERSESARGAFFYEVSEETLWKYRMEFIKWQSGDPSTQPGPIQGGS